MQIKQTFVEHIFMCQDLAVVLIITEIYREAFSFLHLILHSYFNRFLSTNKNTVDFALLTQPDNIGEESCL